MPVANAPQLSFSGAFWGIDLFSGDPHSVEKELLFHPVVLCRREPMGATPGKKNRFAEVEKRFADFTFWIGALRARDDFPDTVNKLTLPRRCSK